MKIVDAFTGREVKVGDVVPGVAGNDWRLMDVEDTSFYNVRARIRSTQTGEEHWSPLQVRFTHPSFLFTSVAFVPS